MNATEVVILDAKKQSLIDVVPLDGSTCMHVFGVRSILSYAGTIDRPIPQNHLLLFSSKDGATAVAEYVSASVISRINNEHAINANNISVPSSDENMSHFPSKTSDTCSKTELPMPLPSAETTNDKSPVPPAKQFAEQVQRQSMQVGMLSVPRTHDAPNANTLRGDWHIDQDKIKKNSLQMGDVIERTKEQTVQQENSETEMACSENANQNSPEQHNVTIQQRHNQILESPNNTILSDPHSGAFCQTAHAAIARRQQQIFQPDTSQSEVYKTPEAVRLRGRQRAKFGGDTHMSCTMDTQGKIDILPSMDNITTTSNSSRSCGRSKDEKTNLDFSRELHYNNISPELPSNAANVVQDMGKQMNPGSVEWLEDSMRRTSLQGRLLGTLNCFLVGVVKTSCIPSFHFADIVKTAVDGKCTINMAGSDHRLINRESNQVNSSVSDVTKAEQVSSNVATGHLIKNSPFRSSSSVATDNGNVCKDSFALTTCHLTNDDDQVNSTDEAAMVAIYTDGVSVQCPLNTSFCWQISLDLLYLWKIAHSSKKHVVLVISAPDQCALSNNNNWIQLPLPGSIALLLRFTKKAHVLNLLLMKAYSSFVYTPQVVRTW